jgi:predicted ester cyclase
MATATTQSVRIQREGVVQAHIKAEAVDHDVASVVRTFRHPRYEVPALATVADGTQAVEGLVGHLLAAFPDFYLHQIALYHSDDAVIVECRFGGTHKGVWAGIEPTGRAMEVQSALIFVFEGNDLICEKVYFDHDTILRQLNVAS